jgi:RNA polymerase sigma factor (sigma-70 family)
MNSTIDIYAIREGDEKAFVVMYYLLNGKVYNFFLKRTRHSEVAKELTQQCFIRIYNYRTSLSLSHPPEKQVYIIAKSVLLNHLRQEERKTARELNYAQQMYPVGADTSDNANTGFETLDLLEKITRHLPPVRKKVILLKARQGLSNKEIAAQLSISVKTVENHLTKATRQLRILSPDLLIVLGILFSNVNKM